MEYFWPKQKDEKLQNNAEKTVPNKLLQGYKKGLQGLTGWHSPTYLLPSFIDW